MFSGFGGGLLRPALLLVLLLIVLLQLLLALELHPAVLASILVGHRYLLWPLALGGLRRPYTLALLGGREKGALTAWETRLTGPPAIAMLPRCGPALLATIVQNHSRFRHPPRVGVSWIRGSPSA